MGNPARELAQMLEGWRTVARGKALLQERGGQGQGDDDFWRRQIHVVELLGNVSRVLQAAAATGRAMPHYERTQIAWVRGVFAPDIAWNSAPQGAQKVIDQSAVDMLYGLADYIDVTELSVTVDPAQQKSIEEALEEISGLLSSEDIRLGDREKRYVFELIMSIRGVFGESDMLGEVDLLRRVHELFGYLTRLADDLESTPGSKPVAAKLRKAAKRVLPYVRFTTGFVTGALGTAADLQSLTQ